MISRGLRYPGILRFCNVSWVNDSPALRDRENSSGDPRTVLALADIRNSSPSELNKALENSMRDRDKKNMERTRNSRKHIKRASISAGEEQQTLFPTSPSLGSAHRDVESSAEGFQAEFKPA